MKIGELDVSKIMLGSDEVEKVYLGTEQVYGGSEPQPTPYDEQYLTFVAKESGTFKFSGNSIDYSIDSGNTWTTLASDTDSPTVASGGTIMWKASGLTPSSSNGIGTFSSTGMFDAQGNVMSLVYGDNFSGQTTIPNQYQFKFLFSGATHITSAENMILPATTLANYCYYQMFVGCTSLTTAPVLPATTLVSYCYSSMFRNCSSLNYIKCLATDISAGLSTSYWVNGVASTGTFVKAASMSSWSTGIGGIPNGWTVENDDGSLPVNDLEPDPSPIENPEDIE